MELAAMEGRPRTLQDSFEEADDEESLGRFHTRLDRALALLSEKLYANTRSMDFVAPYRAFGLHAKQQLVWMRGNSDLIVSYVGDRLPKDALVSPERVEKLLRNITRNEDGLDSEVCVSHGDLNFANVICDESDNVWFIDWTHCGPAPVELDFGKLENDVKFVMSKDFDVEDLVRLKQLEEYLLSHRLPSDANGLPESLKFVKWDLRFRKILEAVRRIRAALFHQKESEDWLVYKVALLRYAMHTLSFDKRRGRGECDETQLMYALYSVEALAFDLVSDDFNLRIRSERPSEYPERQRISIDEAPWMFECPDYSPPYFVHPSVLESDRTTNEEGWADPEVYTEVEASARLSAVKNRDEVGRPLNPRGRTGIAGRGLLGFWGPNLSVSACVCRTNAKSGDLEVLLGREASRPELELPKGFVLSSETPEAAMGRVLRGEVGWDEGAVEDVVFDGFTYDPRQTDNAWVESRSFLVLVEDSSAPRMFDSGGVFDEVRWYSLDAETVNRVPPAQARFIRAAVERLRDLGRMDAEAATRLLSKTG
jgi:ADP-ribose pyrophosphatase